MMKIFIHGYVLLSNLLLIMSIAVTIINAEYNEADTIINAEYNEADTIINAEYNEADYMSDFLKALKPTPTGWSNKTHYCEWKGISCDSSLYVTSIMLPSNSLTGTLPPNIHSLANLTHIDLHNNTLNGPLPYFHTLHSLQNISLGHNNFTSYPDECIYFLPNLRTLNLSNNLNLNNWEFPMDDLRNSEYLETLDLEATNMMGKLDSDTYFSFGNLHTFFISHNKIRENPLQYLAQFPIRYLQLNNNKFEGTISAISSMSNLSQAWLHNNSFTGQIPNMSNCTNLFDLQLQSNYLIGFVPSSLLNLSSLKVIFLDNNMLHGPIPVFRKSVVNATWEPNNFCRSDVGPCDSQVMTLLEIFEAFDPYFWFSIKGNDACPGGLRTDISTDNIIIRCERGKIVTFKIQNNYLKGTISPAFSNLTSLVNLTLADNDLNGSIPDSLNTLPQLQLLDVSNNNLSGVVPKFSPKVKLNTTGNDFLIPNKCIPVIWIAGPSIIIIGFVILPALIVCMRYYILIKRSRRIRCCLQNWIYKDLEQGNNPDNCIANSDEENDMVRQITMVSLWCIQMNPSDRPSMSKVLEMLQGSLQSVSYPPKPFLHSPEVSSLQTSYVSSNNLLNTN
ncbi:hypothetical protein P8452_60552 [Trifolium repens]|nr:hypothetical protein P8452_60552 [Trifolium repens]